MQLLHAEMEVVHGRNKKHAELYFKFVSLKLPVHASSWLGMCMLLCSPVAAEAS
jgi:hypothetical protein